MTSIPHPLRTAAERAKAIPIFGKIRSLGEALDYACERGEHMHLVREYRRFASPGETPSQIHLVIAPGDRISDVSAYVYASRSWNKMKGITDPVDTGDFDADDWQLLEDDLASGAQLISWCER